MRLDAIARSVSFGNPRRKWGAAKLVKPKQKSNWLVIDARDQRVSWTESDVMNVHWVEVVGLRVPDLTLKFTNDRGFVRMRTAN